MNFPFFFLTLLLVAPGSFLLSPDKEPRGWACPASQAGQHVRTRSWEDSQLRSCPQNVLVVLFCVKEKHCWNPVSSLFGFCLSAYFCLLVLNFSFWDNYRFTGNCKKKNIYILIYTQEVLFTLHPSFPNVSILHNFSTVSTPWNWHWYTHGPYSHFTSYTCVRVCVCVCVCVCSCVQFYHTVCLFV